MKRQMTFRFLFSAMIMFMLCSSAFASAPDSSGIRYVNGKKFITHKVENGEYWYSIARRYKITYAALQAANPGVTGAMHAGQMINVPFPSPAASNKSEENKIIASSSNSVSEVVPGKKSVASSKNNPPLGSKTITVEAGQTIFSIARENGISLSDLIDMNKLQSDVLSIGQKLIVSMPGQSISADKKEEKKTVSQISDKPMLNDSKKNDKAEVTAAVKTSSSRSDATIINASASVNAKEVNEKGVASWIDDKDINPSRFYALHKTAPAGTIIKVTNAMNAKTVYVKVVGNLPDTGDNRNISIKLSKAAVEKIDAIDLKFQVELSYGLPQ
jgi:LysM repeat protein